MTPVKFVVTKRDEIDGSLTVHADISLRPCYSFQCNFVEPGSRYEGETWRIKISRFGHAYTEEAFDSFFYSLPGAFAEIVERPTRFSSNSASLSMLKDAARNSEQDCLDKWCDVLEEGPLL